MEQHSDYFNRVTDGLPDIVMLVLMFGGLIFYAFVMVIIVTSTQATVKEKKAKRNHQKEWSKDLQAYSLAMRSLRRKFDDKQLTIDEYIVETNQLNEVLKNSRLKHRQ